MTCEDCRHCSSSCYCDIWEKEVDPNSPACSESVER